MGPYSRAKKSSEVFTSLVSKENEMKVSWDRKGIPHIEFMEQGITINSEVYYETLRKLMKQCKTNNAVS